MAAGEGCTTSCSGHAVPKSRILSHGYVVLTMLYYVNMLKEVLSEPKQQHEAGNLSIFMS